MVHDPQPSGISASNGTRRLVLGRFPDSWVDLTSSGGTRVAVEPAYLRTPFLRACACVGVLKQLESP